MSKRSEAECQRKFELLSFLLFVCVCERRLRSCTTLKRRIFVENHKDNEEKKAASTKQSTEISSEREETKKSDTQNLFSAANLCIFREYRLSSVLIK